MRLIRMISGVIGISVFLCHCSKPSDDPPPAPAPTPVTITAAQVQNQPAAPGTVLHGVSVTAKIRLRFNKKINRNTVMPALQMQEINGGTAPAFTVSYENQDSSLVVTPSSSLKYLTNYSFVVSPLIEGKDGGKLQTSLSLRLNTGIDSTRKFPILSDEELLTKIQQQTFKYFWDHAHPVSGLARERNTSGDIVTSGGSGFGIMSIPVGIERNFITRDAGLQRLQTIVSFLKNDAEKVKGAFPHWLNGSTGAIIPFSAADDGADLVETSFLIMGLLSAKAYFDGADPQETSLRNDITDIYHAVEWDWFTQGGQQTLYWHYSPNNGWAINLPITGWNECLVTYILATASPTHGIPASVYQTGWKSGNNYLNGNSYYGYPLPLGPAFGGPMFLSHYSFLGINPQGLSDGTVNYEIHTENHSKINYQHSIQNPHGYYGYSDSVWGLTASDIPNGYQASSPTADVSVIAPTAAIASLPYAPAESMGALKFYYYVLGDKLFKEYGFVDAFSLDQNWFANSFLAIDQGPIIVMIENYRTGLLWNLFSETPEVQSALTTLGFTAPYL